jgi:hypothetical protein
MNEFVDLVPVISALLVLAGLLLLAVVGIDRLRHRAPEPDEDGEDGETEQQEEGASGEWAAILHGISEELHMVPAPPLVGQYALQSWWKAPDYTEAPQTFYDEVAAEHPLTPFDEELLSFTASWSREYVDGILAAGAPR